MRGKSVKRGLDGLAALLLFGLFAACVLGVLLTGAGAYRRLAVRDRAAYERRSCTQYVATRVRQADRPGGVAVGQLGGIPALRLADDGGYVTYVYCCNGYLMELYTSADAELAPEDGEKLMEAVGFVPSLEDGLLRVAVSRNDGTEDTLYLSLRSEGGAS